MDDTSEDDEDEEATAGPTEVWSDYYGETLPSWMINVDTDGCTCEDEENDEGGKGRSRCSDYRAKLSLYGWLMSVRQGWYVWRQRRWRNRTLAGFFFGYEKATDLRTFGAPVRQMVQRQTPSRGRPVIAYFLVIRYLSFSWFCFFVFFWWIFLSLRNISKNIPPLKRSCWYLRIYYGQLQSTCLPNNLFFKLRFHFKKIEHSRILPQKK